MRREIRDFYDLKRQRVRRQRTERDDKPINQMKISHMAQQPSAFQQRNTQFYDLRVEGSRRLLQCVFACSSRMTFPEQKELLVYNRYL